MGLDRSARKRPVNMSLNEDLVVRARQLTPNLSETVEELLGEWVRNEAAREARVAATLEALNALDHRFGDWADEFSSL